MTGRNGESISYMTSVVASWEVTIHNMTFGVELLASQFTSVE